MDCVYIPICKLLKYEGENCANEDICRFFSETFTPSKPIKKDPDDADLTETGPSKTNVAKARAKIGRLYKRLDENQLSAVTALEGKRYSGMSVPQREQLINIAKAL